MISLSRTEIEDLIDPLRAAEAIEAAYRAVSRGEVNLPPVGHIAFPQSGGDCHIKYGHITGEPIFVIKVATGFPGNEASGLPNGNGVVMVLSSETGEVRAVLHDEMVMTDIRTGLGGAIASRLLARKDSRRIVIVGTGVQAHRQIEAHSALLGDDVIFHIWGRSRDKAAEVARSHSGRVAISVAEDLPSACAAADVIVTVTGATAPFIQADWIKPGTHVTAVGADAPGKQELESVLVASAGTLVADLSSQCLDHGEFAVPFAEGLIAAERVRDLGDVLNDNSLGRKSDDEITIADLTGLAVQDIAMAGIVLDAQTGRGQA